MDHFFLSLCAATNMEDPGWQQMRRHNCAHQAHRLRQDSSCLDPIFTSLMCES